MKVLKKIGLGIISLGLISTFYIPESNANPTILKLEMPSNELSGGRSYPTKIKNSLLAHHKNNSDAGAMRRAKKNNSKCHKHVMQSNGKYKTVSEIMNIGNCKKTLILKIHPIVMQLITI